MVQRSEVAQGHAAPKVAGLGLKLGSESTLLEFILHCPQQYSLTH